jgi:hypothetical protein
VRRSGILWRRDLVVEPELPLQKQVRGSDLQSSELLTSGRNLVARAGR